MCARTYVTGVRRRSQTRARTRARCAGWNRGSGCTTRVPRTLNRSRNVPVSGTRRVLKSGSRGRAKFRGNIARPSLTVEYASGIKSTGRRSLSVCLSVSLPAASMLARCSGWRCRAAGVALVRFLSRSQDSLPPPSPSSSIPSCSRPNFQHTHLQIYLQRVITVDQPSNKRVKYFCEICDLSKIYLKFILNIYNHI